MIELIIGGARSGKSRYAESLALAEAAAGRRVVYIATGEANDVEMAARIAHHRSRRPANWRLVEEPLQLAAALREHAAADTCVLVDCLTLWLTNLILADQTPVGDATDGSLPSDCPQLTQQRTAFFDTLPTLPGAIILVSNEVGWGIVPLGALSRRFVDEQGRLNQDIAACADKVTLVAAGLPLVLKA